MKKYGFKRGSMTSLILLLPVLQSAALFMHPNSRPSLANVPGVALPRGVPLKPEEIKKGASQETSSA